ncbi:MAG: RNA-guided endonuclease InsQ/TnpB family protein [Promethearchaeota archaeon]
MTITRRTRIFPTSQQEQVLWALSEKCRLLYNFALAERRRNWELNQEKLPDERTYITYSKQQNDLPSIKKRYPGYAWVYSKVLQMVLRRLDADYRSFFARWKKGDQNAHPPRFKGKYYFTTLCYNQSGFIIDVVNKQIRFSHNHPSGMELTFNLVWLPHLSGKVKQVEIFQDRSCRWFVAIVIDEKVPMYDDNRLYQAIDLGIINLVTTVNLHGKFVQVRNRRADLYWRKKIREVQSKRDHCKQFSNKWYRYDVKLKKMKQRMVHQLRDFQHKTSSRLVKNTKANTIILGDLRVKDMVQKQVLGSNRQTKAKKTLNHSTQNTGFLGRFAEFLTYKAQRVGKKVVRIDESYTTQTCCICRKVMRRQLSDRLIQCDCGNTLDRDKNAAVNIMVRFLSQQPPVNGEPLQIFLDGLYRHTALSLSTRVEDSIEAPV